MSATPTPCLNPRFTVDTRPRQFGWAPGNYQNKCMWCCKLFIGNKMAVECAPCAYGESLEAPEEV